MSFSHISDIDTRHPDLWQKFVLLLFHHFSLATIHGLNYIASMRLLFLRVFWTLTVLFFLFLGGITSSKILINFYQEPFEVVLQDHSFMPITKVPFPTVTICANQFSDRWNLARMSINMLEPILKDQHSNFMEDFKKSAYFRKISPRSNTVPNYVCALYIPC